jgi:hypothetical protein
LVINPIIIRIYVAKPTPDFNNPSPDEEAEPLFRNASLAPNDPDFNMDPVPGDRSQARTAPSHPSEAEGLSQKMRNQT